MTIRINAPKDNKPELSGIAVGNKAAKITAVRHFLHISAQIFKKIFADPAADHRVIGADQHGNDRIDPAAELSGTAFTVSIECTDGALPCRASDGSLRYDHRVSESQRQQDVDQQEDPAAVLGSKIWKAPDIAQSDGGTGCREHITDLS